MTLPLHLLSLLPFPVGSRRMRPIGRLSTLVRIFSKCSFSLYATHFPLMFLSALWAVDQESAPGGHDLVSLLLYLCLLFEVPLKWYLLIIRTLPILSQKCGFVTEASRTSSHPCYSLAYIAGLRADIT